MAIITLTTDWGERDPYLASVQGKIYDMIPEARIVQVSNSVDPFNLHQAAFIIKNSYPSFPKGTIHLIGLNTTASIDHPHVVVKYKGQYFIGADTGIFSMIFDNNVDEVWEIDVNSDSNYYIFSTRDVFIKVASHIIQGKSLAEIGEKVESVRQMMLFEPIVDNNHIKGKVIYIDNYENAITNIPEEVFRKTVKNKKFKISFSTIGYTISKISDSYDDAPEGEMLALFSSTGFLEIAINRGKASSLLGLQIDVNIMVEIL